MIISSKVVVVKRGSILTNLSPEESNVYTNNLFICINNSCWKFSESSLIFCILLI